MAILEIDLPSGYKVDYENLMYNLEDSNKKIKKIETSRADTNVIFYFDSIKNDNTCVDVPAGRINRVANSKPRAIKLYDYYNKVETSRIFYEPPSLKTCDICEKGDCDVSCGRGFYVENNEISNDFLKDSANQSNIVILLELIMVLVTGASGFVASHIVKTLLELGAKVRGTVRSLQNEEKVSFLRNLVENPAHPLELVEADLLKEETWAAAVKGCKYVLHVASPFPLAIPNSPDDLIKPAVDGTLSVLKACQEEKSVKRVVLTSSVVAIYEPYLPLPKDAEESKLLTEEHWIDGNDVNIEPYPRSKALAEKSAWDFVKEIPDGKNKFELAVINPSLVLGPLLNKADPTSVELRTVLNIEPIDVEKTIIDTGNSLVELGVVKSKAKKQKKVKDSEKNNVEAKAEEEKTKEFEPEDKEKLNAANEIKSEVVA
ncbi:hypothetical protein RND71_043733 [Anisodus tanguticus]|uniref:Dihydroflavonol 4-reductase n=1 Tax=Anisodus tanguticus TaxID=243964 RepID=A0AAE1QS37_9SOLA|nr:hypothetical protein RND71_043733 [Anisodus tanguticus]